MNPLQGGLVVPVQSMQDTSNDSVKLAVHHTFGFIRRFTNLEVDVMGQVWHLALELVKYQQGRKPTVADFLADTSLSAASGNKGMERTKLVPSHRPQLHECPRLGVLCIGQQVDNRKVGLVS